MERFVALSFRLFSELHDPIACFYQKIILFSNCEVHFSPLCRTNMTDVASVRGCFFPAKPLEAQSGKRAKERKHYIHSSTWFYQHSDKGEIATTFMVHHVSRRFMAVAQRLR
jgi:hypothetical protein